MQFRQSLNDFPLTVSLGNKVPAWGLTRWGANSPLRFVPPDDEGFTLRGNTRRIIYKGRRRSHRFTILSDGAFEYDVILNKEPESNVISLPMEGLENFDFYRQPDFIKDPLLAGSYAVYKKETLLGEGTGKLCHIHRPEIIDARGRQCWGDLSVVENCLCISIPEQWLGEAKYPVVVDPAIGTTTVGSQYLWNAYPSEPWVPLMFEISIPVNRFYISETINGLCTAYFYTNEDDYSAGGRPVLYSDNSNSPLYRKSVSEQFADFRVVSGRPKGWRSAAFSSNGSIPGGSYIWFGCCIDIWFPRFDYGAKCYWGEHNGSIPNVYPHHGGDYYDDFKLSMYFTYISAQNYVRRITQGVSLFDGKKLSALYKRQSTQAVKVNSTASRFQVFCRNCVMTARAVADTKRYPVFLRAATEQLKANTDISVTRSLIRNCFENVTAHFGIQCIHGFARVIREAVKCVESLFFPVILARVIADKTIAYEVKRHSAKYVKKLEASAFNIGESVHKAEYYRLNTETIQAEGVLFRGLIMLVRLFSALVLRDYIFGRFLKAREELKLKSCISREIILDSKII